MPWFFGVFALAILLHLSWAILLVDGEDALGATPLHTLSLVFGNRYGLIGMLVVASLLAGWSVAWPIRSRLGIVALLPQQYLLLLSGGGALSSIVQSTYADGVLRPGGFIASDQLPILILASAHTLGILWVVIVEARPKRHG